MAFVRERIQINKNNNVLGYLSMVFRVSCFSYEEEQNTVKWTMRNKYRVRDKIGRGYRETKKK